jgi:hypothetical protein
VEIDDDFVAFRAAHPSTKDALASCDHPVWLVRIAFAAATNKKAVIRVASRAARMFNSPDVALLNPFPAGLDVVDVWSENPRVDPTDIREMAKFKAFVYALPLALPLLVIVDRTLGETVIGITTTFVTTVATLVGYVIWAKRRLRRRAASLDAASALLIVTDYIARATLRDHGAVSGVVDRLRSKLPEAADA